MRLIFDIPEDLNSYAQFAMINAASKAVNHWHKFKGDWSQGAIATFSDPAYGARFVTSTKRTRSGYSVKVRFEEDEPDAA